MMLTMSVFMYLYNYFTGIVIFTITVIFQMTIIVGKKFQYRPSLTGIIKKYTFCDRITFYINHIRFVIALCLRYDTITHVTQ